MSKVKPTYHVEIPLTALHYFARSSEGREVTSIIIATLVGPTDDGNWGVAAVAFDSSSPTIAVAMAYDCDNDEPTDITDEITKELLDACESQGVEWDGSTTS